jgi:hypothetical protein
MMARLALGLIVTANLGAAFAMGGHMVIEEELSLWPSLGMAATLAAAFGCSCLIENLTELDALQQARGNIADPDKAPFHRAANNRSGR